MLAGGAHACRTAPPARAAGGAQRHRMDTGPAVESLATSRPSSSSRRSEAAGGVVLSRIAESLFWIGRYVERAEDTARILDVQTQMMVEDPTVDDDSACRTLLSVMGTEIPEGRLDAGGGAVPAGLRHRRGHLDHVGRSRRPARAPAGRARRCRRDLWEVDQHDVPATSRRAGSARCAPRTRSAGCASGRRGHQRHRRRDDEPRRGLAVPGARPVARAGGHDRAAGRDLGAEPGRRLGVADDAAGLRRLPVLPAHLPRAGDRPRGGRVPAARPAVPALGGATA